MSPEDQYAAAVTAFQERERVFDEAKAVLEVERERVEEMRRQVIALRVERDQAFEAADEIWKDNWMVSVGNRALSTSEQKIIADRPERVILGATSG